MAPMEAHTPLHTALSLAMGSTTTGLGSVAQVARATLAVGDAVLTTEDVAAVLSLSPSALEALVAAGQFPRPLVLTHRRRGWKASTVREWIESRPQATRADNLPAIHA